MKSTRIPLLVLALLCGGYLWGLVGSAPLLPERVATHFGAKGEPDQWMDRATVVLIMGTAGVGLPLLLAGFAFATRRLPIWSINLPNRDYWLAPENEQRARDYILAYMVWLACLVVCFMAGLYYVTVQANQQTPVRLPGTAIGLVFMTFLAGFVLWITRLLKRFQIRRSA
jgi:hypothetical protein